MRRSAPFLGLSLALLLAAGLADSPLPAADARTRPAAAPAPRATPSNLCGIHDPS